MNKSIQGNANGIVEQAKQTVATVASDAKAGVTAQLEQRIDQGKGVAVEKIETVSDALRGASEKLEGTGPLPQLAEKAAEGIDNLAQYFENKTIGDLFRSVEQFARREPALFLGGALAVGVIAGRFLKSSARRDVGRYASAGGGGGYGDQYETFGYEGEYGSEGDYLSADDLEDDWDAGDTGDMSFQSESSGIGVSGSMGGSDWGRTTQPQGSSFGSATTTKGGTAPMPVTQGTTGAGGSYRPPSNAPSSNVGGGTGLAGASSTGSSAAGGGINVGEAKVEANKADDFFKSGR